MAAIPPEKQVSTLSNMGRNALYLAMVITQSGGTNHISNQYRIEENLAGIKLGDFGQNTILFNLANIKLGDSVPQPKYYVTTMK